MTKQSLFRLSLAGALSLAAGVAAAQTNGDLVIALEAECPDGGNLGDWDEVDTGLSDAASGGAAVRASTGDLSSPDEDNALGYKFTVEMDGTYRLYLRVETRAEISGYVRSTTESSGRNREWQEIRSKENLFQWIPVEKDDGDLLELEFNAGEHWVELSKKLGGGLVADKLQLQHDSVDGPPQGMGALAQNCKTQFVFEAECYDNYDELASPLNGNDSQTRRLQTATPWRRSATSWTIQIPPPRRMTLSSWCSILTWNAPGLMQSCYASTRGTGKARTILFG